MSYESDEMFVLLVFSGAILFIATVLAFPPSGNKIMELGDEVTTTDEYTILFNDSFSGRIVSIDQSYTVRNENGNERVFEWKWIDHVDAEGDI